MLDRILIKSIIMFGILVFVVLGCSNMIHHTGVKPTTPILKPSQTKIIYQPIHDTLYRSKAVTIDEVKFRTRIERLLDKSETAFDDINQIKELNVQIQQQNVILFNRAHEKRIENDSLRDMVKSIKDTLTFATNRANQFYIKNQSINQIQQENKSINENINWQFWIAFFIVLTILCGNLFLTSRINKHYNKSNSYV